MFVIGYMKKNIHLQGLYEQLRNWSKTTQCQQFSCFLIFRLSSRWRQCMESIRKKIVASFLRGGLLSGPVPNKRMGNGPVNNANRLISYLILSTKVLLCRLQHNIYLAVLTLPPQCGPARLYKRFPTTAHSMVIRLITTISLLFCHILA